MEELGLGSRYAAFAFIEFILLLSTSFRIPHN